MVCTAAYLPLLPPVTMVWLSQNCRPILIANCKHSNPVEVFPFFFHHIELFRVCNDWEYKTWVFGKENRVGYVLWFFESSPKCSYYIWGKYTFFQMSGSSEGVLSSTGSITARGQWVICANIGPVLGFPLNVQSILGQPRYCTQQEENSLFHKFVGALKIIVVPIFALSYISQNAFLVVHAWREGTGAGWDTSRSYSAILTKFTKDIETSSIENQEDWIYEGNPCKMCWSCPANTI